MNREAVILETLINRGLPEAVVKACVLPLTAISLNVLKKQRKNCMQQILCVERQRHVQNRYVIQMPRGDIVHEQRHHITPVKLAVLYSENWRSKAKWRSKVKRTRRLQLLALEREQKLDHKLQIHPIV